MFEKNESLLTSSDEIKNELSFESICLTHGDRIILDNIQGRISSKNILALMGPSGSGKSSLLNVLSFRSELLGSALPKGNVTINNRPASRKDRYRIGFVMQEDTFFPTLTLYETLTFYVNLRMPKKYTKAQKNEIIEKIGVHMQLQKCMNTVMGGGLIRGLSGGERKRASVACELITNPIVLMLDEPTSGLDSYMASNVIQILKDYCQSRNIIVIASIHQPSSQTFHNFDRVMLLTCGKMAYEGPTGNISQFFSNCGFECPSGWNIADYLLDVVGYDETSINKVVEKFKETNKPYINNINNSDENKIENSPNGEGTFISNDQCKKWPAGIKTQFMCLLRRSFLLSIEETVGLLNMSKTIITCLLLGSVWFQIEWNASNLRNILGLLYYVTIDSFASPLFSSVLVFTTEKQVISRERMASMYSLQLYYITKIISEIPSLVIKPIMKTIIIYPMVGLQKGPTFLLYFIILVLSNIIGEIHGLFLSSLGLKQKETLTIMVVIFITYNLFGGFFNSNLPNWLAWGRYISPIYQLYVLQVYVQFNYQDLICDVNATIPECQNTASSDVISVNEIMEIIRADIAICWFAILSLTMLLLLYIITYLILRKTITKATTGFRMIEICNITNLITKKYRNQDINSKA